MQFRITQQESVFKELIQSITKINQILKQHNTIH